MGFRNGAVYRREQFVAHRFCLHEALARVRRVREERALQSLV